MAGAGLRERVDGRAGAEAGGGAVGANTGSYSMVGAGSRERVERGLQAERRGGVGGAGATDGAYAMAGLVLYLSLCFRCGGLGIGCRV